MNIRTYLKERTATAGIFRFHNESVHCNNKLNIMRNWLPKPSQLPVMMVFAFLLLSFSSIGQVNSYRSVNSGNWNVLGTWERFDGTNWLTPTAGQGTPNSTDDIITIRSPHTVTVTAGVTVDQVVVDPGGKVTVKMLH